MAHVVPPFTAATALEKVKFAQNAWNTMNPEIIAKGTMGAILGATHRCRRSCDASLHD
jgi:nuclear transport factor 2 (NTF2) superfamily protein